MNVLRTPLLVVSIVLFVLTVALELGSSLVPGGRQDAATRQLLLEGQLSGELRETYQDLDSDEVRAMLEADRPPGIGISYMALIDAILAYTMVLVGLGLVLPERVQGRVQGLVTFILSLMLVLGALALAFAALGLLLIMVGLFLAVPFGTIAYLAKFGFFDTGSAAVILSLLMTCKLVATGLLIAAHQRFLENRGLIILILLSLLANVILAFLHGFPPGFLVSITDALGALIFAILAVIWGVMLLIGALGSVIKALRFDRGLV